MKRLPLLIPILAASLCFSGIPPRPAAAADDGTAIGSSSPKVIQELGKAIAEGDQSADVAARLLKFSWPESRPSGQASFIEPDIADNAQLRSKAFTEALAAWVKSKPESAAWVYYVIGTGRNVPDWVKGDAFLNKQMVTERPPKLADAEAQLRTCLAGWTHAPAGKRPDACGKGVEAAQANSPMGATQVPEWTARFFSDAAKESASILMANVSPALLEASADEEDPARAAAKKKLKTDLQAALQGGDLNKAMFDQLFDKYIDHGTGGMAGRVEQFNKAKAGQKVPEGVTVAYEKGTGEDEGKEFLVYQVGGKTVKRVMEVPAEFGEKAVPDAKKAAIQGIASSVLAGDKPKANLEAVVEAGKHALKHPLTTGWEALKKGLGLGPAATASEPHTKDERLEKLNKMHAEERAGHAAALGKLRKEGSEIQTKYEQCVRDAYAAAADIQKVPAGKTPEAWRDDLVATCGSERETALAAQKKKADALKTKAQTWSERNITGEYQAMYYDSIHQDIETIAGRLKAPGASAEDDELRKLLIERYRVQETAPEGGRDAAAKVLKMDPVSAWDLENNAEFKARIDALIAMLKGEGKMEIAQGKPRFSEHEAAVEEYLRAEVRKAVQSRIGTVPHEEPGDTTGNRSELDQIGDLLNPKAEK